MLALPVRKKIEKYYAIIYWLRSANEWNRNSLEEDSDAKP